MRGRMLSGAVDRIGLTVFSLRATPACPGPFALASRQRSAPVNSWRCVTISEGLGEAGNPQKKKTITNKFVVSTQTKQAQSKAWKKPPHSVTFDACSFWKVPRHCAHKSVARKSVCPLSPLSAWPAHGSGKKARIRGQGMGGKEVPIFMRWRRTFVPLTLPRPQ